MQLSAKGNQQVILIQGARRLPGFELPPTVDHQAAVGRQYAEELAAKPENQARTPPWQRCHTPSEVQGNGGDVTMRLTVCPDLRNNSRGVPQIRGAEIGCVVRFTIKSQTACFGHGIDYFVEKLPDFYPESTGEIRDDLSVGLRSPRSTPPT